MTRSQNRLLLIVTAVAVIVLLTYKLNSGRSVVDGVSSKTNAYGSTATGGTRGTVKPLSEVEPLKAGRTVIFERAIHDEVTGALAYSLGLAGVHPTLNINIRHGFDKVLKPALGWEPEIVDVAGNPPTIKQWLADDSISNLILTTCSDVLNIYRPEIEKSSAHVFCVVHHSGGSFRNQYFDKLRELARQHRVTILALGKHVHSALEDDLREWADDAAFQPYADIPVETIVPVFEYPPKRTFRQPAIFPSKVAIQGNIETGRRNYARIFADLTKALKDDPELWGYRAGKEDGNLTYFPLADHTSRFELHLLGQMDKKNPLPIPDELKHVVSLHEGLPYADFYGLVTDCDLLVPAFRQRGAFFETASSTMGTALITRTPVLVSERHVRAYTYLQGPAAVYRGVAEPEIEAIARLRRDSIVVRANAAGSSKKGLRVVKDGADPLWAGYDKSGSTRPPPEVQAAEWRALLDGIHAENVAMWARRLVLESEGDTIL